MPITVEWDDVNQTVIRYTYRGKWTLEEFCAAFDEGRKLMDSVPHTVHIIKEFGGSVQVPRNILEGVKYAEKHIAPNQGIQLLVNGGPLVRMFGGAGNILAPRQTHSVRYAETIEQAYRIINEL